MASSVVKVSGRVFKSGQLLRLHMVDGSSAEGVVVGSRRGWLRCESAKLEAGASMVGVGGELLVPLQQVRWVQVLG